jgi:cytidyltransferase-like protein
MRISDLFEATQKTVVIYPGRFHPFHKGHAAVYRWLTSKFDDVYIATSNKIDPPKSPFSFAEKKQMMMHAGVPASAIVQVKNPYIAAEITDKYDPDNTVAVFAVSEKDMAEDPRFQFKPKKDGSPSYYRPYGSNMEPLNKHGYIITTPTFDFTVLGEPMRSATELRRDFAAADVETQAKMIKDLYGSYNKTIHKIMAAKITQ